MVRREVRIADELGLHARPAARVAELARKFRAKLILKKGKQSAEAESILDVLALACSRGSVVEIVAEGEDAEEAVEALAELLEGRRRDEGP